MQDLRKITEVKEEKEGSNPANKGVVWNKRYRSGARLYKGKDTTTCR
ncbi:hypothetical protein [Candidatus Ichthyocystis sparus]|nr:hypothetical protein [Candidatus Ichthyocystis sparus]